jgi:maltose-binding protein MalE
MLPTGEKTMSRLYHAKAKLLMVLVKMCPAQLYNAEFWSHLFMGFGVIIFATPNMKYFSQKINTYVNSV